MYNVMTIAGPSAVGKSTVAERILSLDNRFSFVRSATTRAPRGDGKDAEYVYFTREEFEKLIENGGVIEYTEYSGELYGTLRSEIYEKCRDGKIPLLILDLNGVRAISRAEGINSCTVYIYDSLSVITDRLKNRYLLNDSTQDEKFKALFLSRKKQNELDYSAIVNFQAEFYSFVKNNMSVTDVAEALIEIYAKFEKGTPRDVISINSAISEIKAYI